MPRSISRDPFARETLERETVEAYNESCTNCGNKRKSGKLFVYFIDKDSIRPLRNQIRGKFCSIGCMRAYHG